MDGVRLPTGEAEAEGEAASPLHSGPTLLAVLCAQSPPSAPDSERFRWAVWVTLALVLPCLWVGPASSLHPEQLSKPQPESVTRPHRPEGEFPQIPQNCLQAGPENRGSSHRANLGDRKEHFPGWWTMTQTCEQTHRLSLGREARERGGRGRYTWLVHIRSTFPAPPYRVGFGGHLTQFGNSLRAPGVSEEDNPSVANARQLAAKLITSASPSPHSRR